MKIYNFNLIYLGGPVDLLKMKSHLAKSYPEASLELVRGTQVLNIPLFSGAVRLSESDVKLDLQCHQFQSGFGSLVVSLDAGEAPQPLTVEEVGPFIHGSEVSMSIMAFFNCVFNTKDLGDLFSKLKDPEQRTVIWESSGVEILVMGQDQCNLGFHGFNCYWTVGGKPESDARDITAGRGLIWARDNNRFWSANESPDLYWDVTTILYREHSAACILEYARGWLGALNRQLGQTKESLRQHNEEIWTQERDEVETLDLNFLSFDIQCRDFLATQEQLYRRENPPAALRLVEPKEWEPLSRYRSRRSAINDLLSECQYAVKRMIRPLDFREFRLLRTGVEVVESRIMLLTVLLVIMEIFSLALESTHWILKVSLLALLILMPVSFILWSKLQRSRIRRRSRLRYLNNLRARAEEEARYYEQQLSELKSTLHISPTTRDYYQSLYGEMLKRIAARISGLKQEIRKLR